MWETEVWRQRKERFKMYHRHRHTNVRSMVLSLVFISIVVVACGNSGSTGTTTLTNGKGCTKIGLLLPDTSTSARWESKDKPLLTQKIQATLPGDQGNLKKPKGDSASPPHQA